MASGRKECQVLVEETLDNPELQKFIYAALEEINSADSAIAKYWATYSEMVEILFNDLPCLVHVTQDCNPGLRFIFNIFKVHSPDAAMNDCVR